MKKILLIAFATVVVALGGAQGTTHAQTIDTQQQSDTTPAPVVATVEKGDSLSKIAAKFNTKWPRIFYANESIQNPDLINPGDQLRIPAESEVLEPRAIPVKEAAPVQTQAAAQVVKKQAVVTTKPTVSRQAPVSYPVSSNAAKAFIYAKESGNNPNATNASGCYGIGQDCNGVLRSLCGANYDCQDEFFTNYAMRRYGSWENALAFWQSHHWW